MRPEWCPADVWEAALSEVIADDTRINVVIIARAILAERERWRGLLRTFATHLSASIDPAADGGGTAPIGAAATSGDGQ